MQVAAYGGKLRYTLSYTAGGQGSPLSDPDVQITVSTWTPAGAPSVLSAQHSAGLARAGGLRPISSHPQHLVRHYPGRGPAAGKRGQ